MIGKIPVKRADTYYLINAIHIIRKNRREIMNFINLLNEDDKLLFENELADYNNAICNYNPNYV